MKKFLNIILIISVAFTGCYTTGRAVQNDRYDYADDYDNYSDAEVSYNTFYNELSPYGSWIDYPEYGRVWRPDMGMGFRPYETGGRWVPTVEGWAWASDYAWGWAPFHYGRWFFDNNIGWAWVPGYEWAPAWVTWGQYSNYYAWAPLAPGINMSFGNTWRAPVNYWSFVPRGYINHSNLGRYAFAGNSGTNINNITIINNYNSYNERDYYHRGPELNEVENFSRQPVTPVAISSASKPGLTRVVNKRLEIYRPSISANSTKGNTEANDPLGRVIRRYPGGLRGGGQAGSGTNSNADRINRNPNLGAPSNDRNRTNGNTGNAISQDDIDRTNEELQQRRIERIRRLREQTLSNQQPQRPVPNSEPVAPTRPYGSSGDNAPSNRNFPQQPSRPLPNMREDRIMQQPRFPNPADRSIRQPQSPSNPTFKSPGGVNMQRQESRIQRPSKL